jgi:hypothetical protein
LAQIPDSLQNKGNREFSKLGYQRVYQARVPVSLPSSGTREFVKQRYQRVYKARIPESFPSSDTREFAKFRYQKVYLAPRLLAHPHHPPLPAASYFFLSSCVSSVELTFRRVGGEGKAWPSVNHSIPVLSGGYSS